MLFEKQILNLYKKMMYTRCDDDRMAFYFSSEDFPGLQKEGYSFLSSKGNRLQGYFYCYDAPKPRRLIVFDHGFGGGHRSYMKEIERLCRNGFLVFSYDHTGCMESEGASPNGMSQSLADLDDCIRSLKSDPRFEGFDLSVMGHSWGGFSTLNITALHPEISRIVVLSGFVSVTELVHTYFDGMMKGYRKTVLDLEKESNPKYFDFHAVNTLSQTSASALLIYSDNDVMCRKKHYDLLKANLEGKSNISFHLEQNKGHNPNYTHDAVEHLAAYGKEKNRLLRRKKPLTEREKEEFLASFDWNRMTAQDEAVWEKILRFLDEEK